MNNLVSWLVLTLKIFKFPIYGVTILVDKIIISLSLSLSPSPFLQLLSVPVSAALRQLLLFSSIQHSSLRTPSTTSPYYYKGFLKAGSQPLQLGWETMLQLVVQWSPSITDTTGTKDFFLFSEVSLAQRVIIDHAPLTIVASYPGARL